MGTLLGTTQNATAMNASNQESAMGLQAEQNQLNQYNQMNQEQSQTNALVNARTAQLINQLTPTNNPPAYQPTGLNTIKTSELGAPDVTTKRSSLLGN